MYTPYIATRGIVGAGDVSVVGVTPPPVGSEVSDRSLGGFSGGVGTEVVTGIDGPGMGISVYFPDITSPEVVRLGRAVARFSASAECKVI